MKRIISLLLTVLVLTMSFMAVPVSAEFSADDITVSVNVYNILVTVTSEDSGTMTAKLTSNNGNTLYGMRSDRTPEEVIVNDTIEYKYDFSFRMRANVPTETYKVTVGNNVSATSKAFPYVRLGDKIDFYDALNVKTAAQIKQFFADNSSLVPVDLTFYNSLEENHADILELVNAEIEALDLATGILETDTDSEKEEKVSAVDELFTTAFAELMEVAAIAAVEEDGWDDLMEDMLGTTFDDYFYDEENVDTAVLDSANVYDNFVIEAALVEEFTVDAYKIAFDRATLAEIEQTRSYGVLKDAFLYYEGKGSIEPDMTDINALIEDKIDADLWKDLSDLNNANCAALIANAESIAEDMMPDEGEEVIGGNSKPVDKPTGGTGGGSLGGGSSETEKPVEPTTPVVPSEPEIPATSTFDDIDSVAWAKESVEALAKKGIINGKGNGKYAPNDKVTREEFVKIIIGAFDLLDESATAEFADVDSTRWSYTFIATANELGIVTGDGANFNPNGAMSRQDMAVVIWRTAEMLGVDFNGEVIDFTDAETISDYAKDAVDALTATGIINGMGDGSFAPKATVTRAQAAKVIYGLMVLCGGGK